MAVASAAVCLSRLDLGLGSTALSSPQGEMALGNWNQVYAAYLGPLQSALIPVKSHVGKEAGGGCWEKNYGVAGHLCWQTVIWRRYTAREGIGRVLDILHHTFSPLLHVSGKAQLRGSCGWGVCGWSCFDLFHCQASAGLFGWGSHK